MIGTLRIGYAMTAEEMALVQYFIDREYLLLFGTTPPPSDFYTVAYEDEQIVGCIGVEFARGRLPIERFYDLQRSTLPLPLTDENGIQYGRWLVKAKNASTSIIYHATLKALSEGKTLGLVEHNPMVHRVATRLGIEFWPIPEARLNLAEVPVPNRPYYAEGRMQPYLVDLHQIVDALKSKV